MTAFTKRGNDVFAPTNADGTIRQIAPQDAQRWSAEVERALDIVEGDVETAFTSGSSIVFSTKAAIDADLDWPEITLAWVTNDPVAANNGIYQKQGASGTGSWTKKLDLPYSFIKATDAGAGTSDAIVATSSIPIPDADGGALIALNIFETNTGSPVTMTINGSTFTVKTNTGNDVAPGGLVAGMIVAGYKIGTTFRLWTDQVPTAVLAGAEAAQAGAEDAQAAAEAAAAALNFPPIGSGDGGRKVVIREDETGYEYEEDTPSAIDEFGRFDIRLHGGAAGNSNATNRAALRTAIVACDAYGGGIVFSPEEVDWGFIQTDESTYPNFSDIINDVQVLSYSNSAAGYTSEGAKQGFQEWRFNDTAQTTPAGQHNGNGFILSSRWHGYIWVNAAGGYIPYNGGVGRDENYNYRASFFLGQGGAAKWQIGQGITRAGNYDDHELLDFSLVGWVDDVGVYFPLIVDYSNGAASYGSPSAVPQAAHHFYKPATATGLADLKFSTAASSITHIWQLGNDYDVNRDMQMVYDTSNWRIFYPNIGIALSIDRASRNATFAANVSIGGAVSKGSGTFLIDHPLDPKNRDLAHGFIEGPRYDLIYRGAVKLKNGRATVNLDAVSKMTEGTFDALTIDAQVTSLQNQDGFARLRPGPIKGGVFEIICEDETSADLVAWTVIAERNDAFVKSGLDPNTNDDGRFVPERAKEAAPATAKKIRKAKKGERLIETEDSERIGKRGTPRHPEAFGLARPMVTVEVDIEAPTAPAPSARPL